MISKVPRALCVTIATAALAAGLGLSAAPAGAAVAAKNSAFCDAFTSNPKAGVIFGVPGRAQAKYTATLLRKLAGTGVPAGFANDLKKLAKIYAPIATGQASRAVRRPMKCSSRRRSWSSPSTSKRTAPARSLTSEKTTRLTHRDIERPLARCHQRAFQPCRRPTARHAERFS